MEKLRLASSHGQAWLELSDSALRDPARPVESFLATLVQDRMEASATVHAVDLSSAGSDTPTLAALFAEMAGQWKGWPGSKTWTSVEEQLSLSCSHDGLGHVRIVVELRPSLYETSWVARGVLVLDTGRLHDSAHSVHRFLRV
jgi:Family of unknown function (DUF6228)